LSNPASNRPLMEDSPTPGGVRERTELKGGIDIGSTTAKTVILDRNNNPIFTDYRRHDARIHETISEVFKKILQQRDENSAFQAIALMQQGKVVDVDSSISLISAKQSLDLKLPMADSIILATANAFSATLWTQDSDFKGIPGVKYIQKSS